MAMLTGATLATAMLAACGLGGAPTGSTHDSYATPPQVVPGPKPLATSAVPQYGAARIIDAVDAPDPRAYRALNGRDFAVSASQVGFFNSTQEELSFIAHMAGVDTIVELQSQEFKILDCDRCTEMSASIRTSTIPVTTHSTVLRAGKLYWLVQHQGVWQITGS